MNQETRTDYTLSLTKILVGFPLLWHQVQIPSTASKTLLDLVSSQPQSSMAFISTHISAWLCFSSSHSLCFHSSLWLLARPFICLEYLPVFLIWKTPTYFHLGVAFVLSFTTSDMNASYVSGTTLRAWYYKIKHNVQSTLPSCNLLSSPEPNNIQQIIFLKDLMMCFLPRNLSGTYFPLLPVQHIFYKNSIVLILVVNTLFVCLSFTCLTWEGRECLSFFLSLLEAPAPSIVF